MGRGGQFGVGTIWQVSGWETIEVMPGFAASRALRGCLGEGVR